MYHIDISLDRDLYHKWVTEAETKVVCGARNKEKLLQALGMEENKDYWFIYFDFAIAGCLRKGERSLSKARVMWRAD